MFNQTASGSHQEAVQNASVSLKFLADTIDHKYKAIGLVFQRFLFMPKNRPKKVLKIPVIYRTLDWMRQ